jgi:hypothetical protein
VVEVEVEPMVIIHPGLVEAMEEKPPTPSTPRRAFWACPAKTG